jgi:ATP:corrinoid adenosyltransferase
MFFGLCLLDIGHPTRVSLAQIMKIKTTQAKNCLISKNLKKSTFNSSRKYWSLSSRQSTERNGPSGF